MMSVRVQKLSAEEQAAMATELKQAQDEVNRLALVLWQSGCVVRHHQWIEERKDAGITSPPMSRGWEVYRPLNPPSPEEWDG